MKMKSNQTLNQEMKSHSGLDGVLVPGGSKTLYLLLKFAVPVENPVSHRMHLKASTKAVYFVTCVL